MFSYGGSVPFGDMGWTGVPAVMTSSGGTGPANASAINAVGGTAQGNAAMACTLCSDPTVQAGVFIFAVILIAIAWHLHLFAMIEG